MAPPEERDLDLVSDVAAITDPIRRARIASERINQLAGATDQLAELRMDGILQMSDAGMSHADIAAQVGLTKARVGQIIRDPRSHAHRGFLVSGSTELTVAIGGKLETGRRDQAAQAVLSRESMAAYQAIAEVAQSLGLTVRHEVVPPPGLVDLNRPSLLALTSPKLLPLIGQLVAGDPYFEFAQDAQGWYLADKATGVEYRSPRDRNEPGDHGYLARLSRPDGRGTFLYCAGIHASGTLAAATYLADNLPELWGRLKTRRFSMLITCELDPKTLDVIKVEKLSDPRVHEDH